MPEGKEMQVMIGQLQEIDEETAAFALQLGITAVQLNTPTLDGGNGYWTYEAVAALKARCREPRTGPGGLGERPPGFYALDQAGWA